MRSSSLFIGLAILVGSAFGACAQTTNTPQVGSTGGAAFDDRCNGTDLMIGYNISENKALSSLQAVCQARNNGALVGAPYGLRAWGKQAQGTAGEFAGTESLSCPPGQAIFGLTIWQNKFKDIDSVAAVCVPLSPNSGPGAQLERTVTFGQAFEESAIGCGLNGVAVGIAGRSGDVMNSLGLKCSQLIADVPPPTNIVKVVAAADVYDHPGGSGQPTYPDGLDPAAPKNIVLVYLLEVGKGDNVNWYRVNWNGSPAQPLWVYSGVAANDQITFDAASLATAIATVNGGH